MAKNMMNIEDMEHWVERVEGRVIALENNLGTLGDKVDILERRLDNEIEARENAHKLSHAVKSKQPTEKEHNRITRALNVLLGR